MIDSLTKALPSAPTVLVFDSGAGGLSICANIMALRPDCSIIYAADNAYFPYGELSSDTLKTRVMAFMGELISIYSPHIVVIACNTASTAVLTHLRQQFDTPFVGVVPAIKPAALATQTGTFAVLATSATITRDYTRDLIEEFAPNRTVLLHNAQTLVTAAEQFIQNGQSPQIAIQATLRDLLSKPGAEHIDTIVLACTHFPLLRDAIQAQLATNIKLLDSGNAIARRVDDLLGPARPTNDAPPRLTVHLSSSCTATKNAYTRFLKRLPGKANFHA